MRNYLITLSLVAVITLSGCTETKKNDEIQKENVMKTLDSGLKYEILKEAASDAKKPTVGSMVAVHYTGWLEENGKEGKPLY